MLILLFYSFYSALYVVDLKKFRKIAAGDRLRGQYQGLSQDPNSLSNLDQVCVCVCVCVKVNHGDIHQGGCWERFVGDSAIHWTSLNKIKK